MKFKTKQKEVAEYSQKWFDFKDGSKFLIADADKPSFNRYLELNGMQAERELHGIQDITDESAIKSQLAFNRAVAHLILGFSNVGNESGQLLEYSPQTAEFLCTSTEESLELVVFCLNKAKQLRDEKNKTVAEEVGKSLNTTSKETSVGRPKKPKKSTKSSV